MLHKFAEDKGFTFRKEITGTWLTNNKEMIIDHFRKDAEFVQEIDGERILNTTINNQEEELQDTTVHDNSSPDKSIVRTDTNEMCDPDINEDDIEEV